MLVLENSCLAWVCTEDWVCTAFCGCSSLERVALPPNLLEVENYTFQGCTNLKSVFLPENIRKIGGETFKGCSSLENITLPSTISVVSYRIFCGCSSLKSMNLPEGVVMIAEGSKTSHSTTAPDKQSPHAMSIPSRGMMHGHAGQRCQGARAENDIPATPNMG